MGLAEVQAALARLATDAALRQRFFDAPESEGPCLGLTADELRQLAEMRREDLERFAATLGRKRLREARRHLPICARALGERFGTLFTQYALQQGLGDERRYLEDALGFAGFLRQRLHREEPHLAELAHFEAARLRASSSAWCLLVRWFWWDVATWATAAASGEPPSDVPRRPGLVVWFRTGRRGAVRQVSVPLWFRVDPTRISAPRR